MKYPLLTIASDGAAPSRRNRYRKTRAFSCTLLRCVVWPAFKPSQGKGTTILRPIFDSGDSRRGTPASLTHDGQVVFVRRRPELRDIKLNISFDKPKAQEPSEGKHLPVARPIRVSAGHIPESARCDAGDLCTLHKPCAKHGGKPGQPIGDADAETRLQSNNSDERGTDSAKC